MCKWKRTKGRNQPTDLQTEYPYYSCLHEVTFINLCINKISYNYLNFTLQRLHYYYFNIIFKGKKLKIRSYQEFSHEIQEKIRKCSKSGKIRNNQENQEVLDGLDRVIPCVVKIAVRKWSGHSV